MDDIRVECDNCGAGLTVPPGSDRLVHEGTTLRNCGVVHGKGLIATCRGLTRLSYPTFEKVRRGDLSILDHLVEAPAPPPERPRTYNTRPPKPGAAFEVIDGEPPRFTKPVPAARLEAIEFCLANPGTWIRYVPTDEQDPVKPSGISNAVLSNRAGFVPGFECRIRSGITYLAFFQEQS